MNIKMKRLDLDSILDFGIHIGKSVEQALQEDPNYYFTLFGLKTHIIESTVLHYYWTKIYKTNAEVRDQEILKTQEMIIEVIEEQTIKTE